MILSPALTFLAVKVIADQHGKTACGLFNMEKPTFFEAVFYIG